MKTAAGKLGSVVGLMLLLAFMPLADIEAAAPAPEGSDPFEEPIQPLKPKRPRSEQDQDDIQAAALFAHGRFLQQRGKQAEALRAYQRAARYAKNPSPILDELVQLAFRMRRIDEGARYAVIASEIKPDDPILMRRLAEHLVDQGDMERALRMYENAARPKEQPEGPVAEAKILREIGRLALLTGDYQKSADKFTRLLELIEDPANSGIEPEKMGEVIGKPELIYRLVAESYLLAERLDDAEKLFRRAAKADSDSAELAYRLARVEQKRGDIEKALAQLDEYFDAVGEVDNDRPYRLLAELLEEKHGDEEKKSRGKLIARLEKMWERDDDNVELGGYLARVELEADRLDKSEAIYEQLMEAQPSLAWNEGLIDVQRKRGDADQLVTAMGDAVEKTNTLSTFQEVLDLTLEDKELTEHVLEVGRRSLKDDSLSDGEALALAYFALASKDNQAADSFFKAALDKAGDARNEMLGAWGLALFSSERFGEAVRAFRNALANAESNDEKSRLNYFLSSALELDGKTKPALAAAQEAVRLASDPLRFANRPAWVLYHAGEHDRAREMYVEFIEKHDEDFTSADIRDLLRETRLILSNIDVRRDRMPQAEEWIEQVLDEFPEDVGALNDLGYLWTDQGKHLQRSLRMVKKAVEAEPDNAAYRDSLGWAYYRLGEHDKAIVELEKAVAAQPDGVILDHLGDAYHEGGKVDKALETWRRAAEAFERDEDEEMLSKTKAKIEKHSN